MWIDYIHFFDRSNDFMNVLNPKSGCVDFQTESFTEKLFVFQKWMNVLWIWKMTEFKFFGVNYPFITTKTFRISDDMAFRIWYYVLLPSIMFLISYKSNES